jgi:hypothetical protein
MGRSALTLSALCAIFGVAVAAQTAPSPSGTARPEIVPQPLRLTGCVKTWDPSTMGPPPAAARGTTTPVPAGPVAPFVLVNAAPIAAETAAGPGAPAGPPAMAGERPARGGHATYLLKPATSAVDLAAHVDRQVEIRGTLVADDSAATPAAQRPAPATPPAPEPPPATPAARAGEDAREPAPPVALTVTAITTIEKACAAK